MGRSCWRPAWRRGGWDRRSPAVVTRLLVVPRVSDRRLMVVDIADEIGGLRPPHDDGRRVGIQQHPVFQPLAPGPQRPAAATPARSRTKTWTLLRVAATHG